MLTNLAVSLEREGVLLSLCFLTADQPQQCPHTVRLVHAITRRTAVESLEVTNISVEAWLLGLVVVVWRHSQLQCSKKGKLTGF